MVAEYRRAQATTQDALGGLFVRAGQYDRAHESLEKGLAIWRQLVGNDAHVLEDRHGLAARNWRSVSRMEPWGSRRSRTRF